MAGYVRPDWMVVGDYHGLPSIFEFTNADGERPVVNCGYAAAATLLTAHGYISPATESPRRIMTKLEAEHPPDNLGGIFGSSRRRITRIFRRLGIHLGAVKGESSLRECLSRGHPAIVLIGVCAARLFNRIELPGGHWTVAYGFDNDAIYLTNYGSMSWERFRRAWVGFVPRLVDMHGKGLILENRALPQMNTEKTDFPHSSVFSSA
jgi:hypothetical protein